MASYDAGTLTNESKRSAKIFKDLNLDFQQNSATKDIQKITDVESVKRSVRNLINMNHYEKPFHPEVGSNLRGMLFENITPQMSHAISKEIDNLIRNYEPRARLVQISTMPDFERNTYSAKISFLLSIPTLGAVSIFGLKNIILLENFNFSIMSFVSIFMSFLFSIMTIKYFLKYIEKFSLNIFVGYRIVLGLILLTITYL